MLFTTTIPRNTGSLRQTLGVPRCYGSSVESRRLEGALGVLESSRGSRGSQKSQKFRESQGIPGVLKDLEGSGVSGVSGLFSTFPACRGATIHIFNISCMTYLANLHRIIRIYVSDESNQH